MKKLFLALAVVLLVAVTTGLYLNHRVSSTTERGPATSVKLLVSNALNGQTLNYHRGDQVTLTTNGSLSGLDVSGYNPKIVTSNGSAEKYQPSRVLEMLSVGQTPLVITVTPSCAIPMPGRPICLIVIQPISLTIVVK